MTMDADELKRGLEIAKGCAYDGRPLDSMTREELMAVAGLLCQERDERERMRRCLGEALTPLRSSIWR